MHAGKTLAHQRKTVPRFSNRVSSPTNHDAPFRPRTPAPIAVNDLRRHAPFAVVLLLTALIYAPGLGGGFVLDDYNVIVDNETLRISTLDTDTVLRIAFAFPSVAHRPLSMLSFAMNWHAFGPSTYALKAVNLAIHLFASVAIYVLAMLLLRAPVIGSRPIGRTTPWVAVFVAAAWLLHPLNLTAVLYTVQRMTSLAALFTLLGLCAYAAGRLRQIAGGNGWPWILSALLVAMPLATLAKENGVLLPPLMLVVETILFRFRTERRRDRAALALIFLLTVALPIVVFLAAGGIQYLLGHYQYRDFTPLERLYTEVRALWWYAAMVVAPNPDALSLFHDDWPISRWLLEPPATLLAIAGLAVVTAFALCVRRRQPAFSFAVFFFLAGHVLESSIVALEPVFEHRNYLPMFGILFAMAVAILRLQRHRALAPVAILIGTGILTHSALATWQRAREWSDLVNYHRIEVERHPDSLRANTEAARAYLFLAERDRAHRDLHSERARFHLQYAAHHPQGTAREYCRMLLYGQKFFRTPITDSQRQTLHRLLVDDKLRPADGDALYMLVRCRLDGSCDIEQRWLEALIEELLAHPQATGRVRASLATIAAIHYEGTGDLGTALRMSTVAHDAQPDARRDLRLAELLLDVGDPLAAARHLENAANRDHYGAFRAERLALGRRLVAQTP